jgi:hypothetical protein
MPSLPTPSQVTWILEITPDFTDPELLTRHVKQFVPIEGFSLQYKDWPKVQGPCAVFGTFNCITQMLRNPDLCNYVLDDYALLECTSYYRHVYPFLGRTAYILPMGALPHLDLSKTFGDSVFIRPNSNKKPFEAQVVATTQTDAYLRKHPQHQDELVILSDVIGIQREFRCFCRNGKTFCHSSYKEDQFGPAPERVIRFADEVAMRILQTLGLAMITVDVAECDSGLKLIEIGGVNSWGIYGVDIPTYIEGMEQAALEKYQELL